MSLNRIQKLLFSEYCDFEDLVLIESPFAEINRAGLGLRQVQIGLTSSKFILASELMKNVEEYPIMYYPNCVDAEIESMELISIFPIELVSLSVWQRRRRKVIKARFHDGNPKTSPKISYYELGGLERKKMFWNLWCEKVRFLTPEVHYGSGTEGTVASSSSADSLFLAHTRITADKIWQYYDSGFRSTNITKSLLARNSLPAKKIQKSESNYKELKTIFESRCGGESSNSSDLVEPGLFWANECQKGDSKYFASYFTCQDKKSDDSNIFRNKYHLKDFDYFCEQALNLWLTNQYNKTARMNCIHPCPDLNHCAGILSTDSAGKYTAQIKRSQSLLSVKEERLHILELDDLRRQRKAVVESQSFQHITNEVITHQLASDDFILYFWTTDYWYKPDKINRKLALCRAKRPEDIQKTRKRLFFGRKRTKVFANFEDIHLAKLQSTLKLDKTISALTLNSDAISSQLTIMDTALFLKITAFELRIFKKLGNVRNCKNFMTWLIFSHRITCLTATQILLAPDTHQRARLVSRFIYVCDKCHKLSNYQSALSVLMGLQSPAIYRLYATWACVRKNHSTAYRIFKFLLTEYSMANLPDLSKPRFLLSSRFFIDTILCKLRPVFQVKDVTCLNKGLFMESTPWHGEKTLESNMRDKGSLPKVVQQILSVFTIGPVATISSSTLAASASTLDEATSFSQSAKSVESSSKLPGLEEAQNILRICQLAGRKYELTNHKDAQEYLQKVPYYEHSVNFQLSLKIEPPS